MPAISLRDIAERCQISVATVSKVLNPGNASYRISSRTRERVLKTCAELGYTPNPQARALRQGRSNRIGFVVEIAGQSADCMAWGEHNRDAFDFAAPVLVGMLTAAARRGFSVEPVNQRTESGMSAAEFAAELLADGRLDAVVLPPGSTYAPRKLVATGKPVVRLQHGSDAGSHLGQLIPDDAAGWRNAVRHLHEIGRPSLYYLGLGSEIDAVRAAACRAAAGEYGIAYAEGRLEQGVARGHGAAAAPAVADALERLWPDTRPPAAAVCCFNEALACGVYALAACRAWRIPDDLAVIGQDDIYARGMQPPLTSLTNMSAARGVAAIELTADMLQGREAHDAVRKLTPDLIVRGSTVSAA